MKKYLFSLRSLIALGILIAGIKPSFAQSAHNLQTDDKIRLTFANPLVFLPENATLKQRIIYHNAPDKNVLVGKFISSDKNDIFIIEKNSTRQTRYPLVSLKKIEKSIPKQKKYLRNMILGFIIGTATVALLLETTDDKQEESFYTIEISTGGAFLVGAFLGGVPGIGLGWLVAKRSGSRWVEIPLISLKR